MREGDRLIIRHDEFERFRRTYRDADVRVERREGNNATVVRRTDGSEIITILDENGNLVRRVRRVGGREVILIDNRRGGPGRGYFADEVLRLPPPVVRIPREEYVVEIEDASQDEIYEAFEAPPVQRIERAYTLDEVRQSAPLRDYMRRVDLDTITFEFGSWELPEQQVGAMTGIGEAIKRALAANPNEIFLVEGHTDAVGSDEDNLSLSDRRAETVATVLTQRFGIPAGKSHDPGLWRAVPEGEHANSRAAEPPGDDPPDYALAARQCSIGKPRSKTAKSPAQLLPWGSFMSFESGGGSYPPLGNSSPISR